MPKSGTRHGEVPPPTVSGVTRGLSLGGANFAEGGPLAIVWARNK